MAAPSAEALRPADQVRERVAYFLEIRGLRPRALSAERLRADYPAFAFGWEITLPTAVGSRDVEVLLPIDYPYRPATIGVQRLKAGVPLVHVAAGRLCLSDSSERHVLRVDEAVLERDLERAAELFAQATDEIVQDRSAEFVDYWVVGATGSHPLYTLITEGTPFGTVAAWHGEAFTLVGPDESTLRAWLRNRFALKEKFQFRDALYLTGERLEPTIGSAAALRAFVDARGEPSLLEALDAFAVNEAPTAAVIFRLPGAFALVGGVLGLPTRRHHPFLHKAKHPGFRPGHVPRKMLIEEHFGVAGQFDRHALQRVDAEWLVARGGENFDQRLRAATVCLVGVGSLGSGIARALLKAGVGSLILIDPQFLRWENIARHELGGRFVGASKAEVLASVLRADFPFARIVNKCASWQDAYREDAALFDVDVVVSTTGDWPDECQLNDLLRRRERTVVLYGWIEPHAAAAQSLIVRDSGGCLACGMSSSGEFTARATDWPDAQLIRVPACGETYAPYADLAASRARALIAGQVLRALTEPEVSSTLVTELYEESLRADGHGTLNARFLERLGHEPSRHGDRAAGFWPRRVDCGVCAAASETAA